MTIEEIKKIKEGLEIRDNDLTLKIIEYLATKKCNESLKLLFKISMSNEFIIEDASLTAILNMGKLTLEYIKGIKVKKGDNTSKFDRHIKYLSQCLTPQFIKELEEKNKI